jgi:aerobic-type carbon monoxide dehydrogenase small subunit (CoxS/CutS family)
VLLDGQSVSSCLTPISSVAGKKILTIEGLATGDKLHPVQEAFLAEDAMQCGRCTPGMVMTLVGLLGERPHPTEAEILSRLEGHICRCCNYSNILKAAKRAAASNGRD